MKSKRLIAIVMSITMLNTIIEPSIFNKAFAITLDNKIITKTDESNKGYKTVKKTKNINNVASKNDNLFSKDMVYSDENKFSGTIPRTSVDWTTNVHVEKEHKKITKKFNVTSKNVDDILRHSENINGHSYSGVLDKINVEYKPIKYGKRPIYNVSTKEFNKQIVKNHLNTNDDSQIDEEYRINEDGYSGSIPRINLKWDGEGKVLKEKITTSRRSSYKDFDDEIYYSKRGYSGYLKKVGRPKASGSAGEEKEFTRSDPYISEPMSRRPPDTLKPDEYSDYEGSLTLKSSTPYEEVKTEGAEDSKYITITKKSDDKDELGYSYYYDEDGYEGRLVAIDGVKEFQSGGVYEPAQEKTISTKKEAYDMEAFKDFDAGYISNWVYRGTKATNKYGYYKYASGDGIVARNGQYYEGSPDIYGLEGPYWIPRGWDKHGGDHFGSYDKTMFYDKDGWKGTLKYTGIWQRLRVSPVNVLERSAYYGEVREAMGTKEMRVYYTGTLRKEGRDNRSYGYSRQYRGKVTAPSSGSTKYRYAYVGTLSKPRTRTYRQKYEGEIEKLVGDYKAIADYKGTLTKKEFDHYEDIPIEWEATVTYEGDISYTWYDYNGVATYRGEVSKLEPIIDIEDKNKDRSNWKENRKVVISLKNSVTKIPVDNSKTKFEITPITNGLSDSDIKYKTHDNICEVVFKKPGDYNCKLTISNGKVTSTKNVKITITPDKKPIVDFGVNDVVYRKAEDNNRATINLIDASYSPDYDTIKRRKWRYKYDSNNDGSFADEEWHTLDDGNNRNPQLKVSKLGKYLIELEAIEEFGQPTIPEFVSESDRKRNNTDSKPIKQKVVEVDNLPPFASFALNQKPKADIVFTLGKCNNGQNKNLNDKVGAYIKSKLLANGIDANIVAVQAVKQTILSGKFSVNMYWDNNGSDMDSHMEFYSNGKKDSEIYYGKKELYGCSLDKDDQHGGQGEWLTLNFDTIPKNIDEIRFRAESYRGSADVNIRLYKDSNGKKSCPVDKRVYVSNHENKSFGKLVRNGDVWDFYGADGEFVPGKVIMENIKPFDEVLKEPEWNPNTHRFVIDLTDDKFLKNVDENKEAAILANLLGNDISLIGLGNSSNKDEFERFIKQNSDKGTFIENSNMDRALAKLGDYITNEVLKNANNSSYVVVDEKVDYITDFVDAENDPEMERKWKYVHDPNYFENSQGLVSFNGKWLDKEIDTFSKVGKYTVTLKAKDNPVGTDDRFDNYRKWSSESAGTYTFYVHRRPVPQFKAIAKRNVHNNNFDIIVNESSYDLDHISMYNRGIAEKKWRWKNANETNWHESMIPSSLPKDENYLVQLSVKDTDGAWSQPLTQYVTTKNINIAPIAQFEIDPNIVAISNDFSLKDFSYDPNGDDIVNRHWTVYKDGTKVYEGSAEPSMRDIKSHGTGKYKITLVVKDNPKSGLPLESDPYSQFLTVVPDNKPPIADFEVTPNPIPTDVNIKIKDKSYDPDGDKIVEKQWRIKNSTSSSWIYLDELPVRLDKYGTGKVQLQLRVKDQPKYPQQRAEWSSWKEKTINVLPGNKAPIADFNPSPNPVPADEPVNYNDKSYDPEGSRITDKVWTVKCRETGEIHEFHNEEPPKIFENTKWGKNLDGVGTYDITLKVKDSSPNGMSPSLWSKPITKTLVVEDPLRINALTMVKLVNAPKATKLPFYFPTRNPAEVKVGYKMKFNVNTNGGDKLDIKLYANGQPLVVHTNNGDKSTITINTRRKNSSDEFEFWLDKKLPKGTIIDIKLVLTKTKLDGTQKSLVNNQLGNNAIKVVGSSLVDYMINLTH